MVEVYPGPGKHAEILDHLLALTLSKGYGSLSLGTSCCHQVTPELEMTFGFNNLL